MTNPPNERQTYRGIVNNLKTTLNGQGNIYQIDLDILLKSSRDSPSVAYLQGKKWLEF